MKTLTPAIVALAESLDHAKFEVLRANETRLANDPEVRATQTKRILLANTNKDSIETALHLLMTIRDCTDN